MADEGPDTSRDEAGNGLYWNARHGGAGELEWAPTAPTGDHYRIVPNALSAAHALAAGEVPIIWSSPGKPDTVPDSRELSRLQQEQWELPGRLFARDDRTGTLGWDPAGPVALIMRLLDRSGPALTPEQYGALKDLRRPLGLGPGPGLLPAAFGLAGR
jgi:hypothetical protein